MSSKGETSQCTVEKSDSTWTEWSKLKAAGNRGWGMVPTYAHDAIASIACLARTHPASWGGSFTDGPARTTSIADLAGVDCYRRERWHRAGQGGGEIDAFLLESLRNGKYSKTVGTGLNMDSSKECKAPDVIGEFYQMFNKCQIFTYSSKDWRRREDFSIHSQTSITDTETRQSHH